MSSSQAKPSSSTSSFESQKNSELDTMIMLKSYDGREYFVKKSVIVKSVTIKNLIDDGCAGDELPDEGSEIKAFNANFVKDLSHENMANLILDGNYLDIKELLDLMSQKIADFIRDNKLRRLARFSIS
ncbi:hypothetical protein RD792_004767 [Penstemon davidsonii]|uniref:SKP1 component POZ domain-containing protein n=1 Tax=Penstemon davidsonii TaxID=160366 RepID=A0ABR0DJ78_9LAMI|nr:hypothetical protein RD792_004767 [Penstemon davidsonii]